MTPKKGDSSPQEPVREMKNIVAPSSLETNKIRDEYKHLMSQPFDQNPDPKDWYNDWLRLHALAIEYQVPEVMGSWAVGDFIDSAGQFAPEWGRDMLSRRMEAGVLGKEFFDIHMVGKIFAGYIQLQQEWIAKKKKYGSKT